MLLVHFCHYLFNSINCIFIWIMPLVYRSLVWVHIFILFIAESRYGIFFLYHFWWPYGDIWLLISSSFELCWKVAVSLVQMTKTLFQAVLSNATISMSALGLMFKPVLWQDTFDSNLNLLCYKSVYLAPGTELPL